VFYLKIGTGFVKVWPQIGGSVVMSPVAAQLVKPLPATEPLARPKVMRRPSQFSSAPTAVFTPPRDPEPTPNLADERLPEPTPALPALLPAPRGWQDDARFGLVLVLALVVVNAALMLWLPHLKHTAAAPVAAPILAEIPTPAARSTVTVYTNPALPAPYSQDGVDEEAERAGLSTEQPYHILGSATDSGPNQ
jgi:hypothetical protein